MRILVTGALVKVGAGMQECTNATNIFLTGVITISAGALGFTFANGGTSSNLTLDGGVFQNTANAATLSIAVSSALTKITGTPLVALSAFNSLQTW